MTDLDLARALAQQAGKVALAIRATGLIEGKALGKAGDRAVNAFLVPAIAQHRPDDALLSEESEDDHARSSAPLWCSRACRRGGGLCSCAAASECAPNATEQTKKNKCQRRS